MVSPRVLRTSVAAFFAIGLMGTLAFLLVRTTGGDYRTDFQALERLRELRDLDQRWDDEALRLASTLEGARPPTAEPGRRADRLSFEIERAPAGTIPHEDLAKIRTGVIEKQKAYEALLAAHDKSVESLKAADDALRAFEAAAAASRLKPGHGVSATDIPQLIERVRLGIRMERVDEVAHDRARLVAAVAALAPAGSTLDPSIGPVATRASDAAREFLSRRDAESGAWRAFSFLTVGARVELLARTQSAAILKALDERELWRVFLFVYAFALLIGLGYAASRLLAASAALRLANEALERTAAEGAREISAARDKLKETEAQLLQTEKMSSLGQLVAGVAHEINEPLASVKGSVAAMRDRASGLRATLDRPEALDDLEALARQGLDGIEHIGELVANLRAFSRLDHSRIASFNVNDSVKATLLIARSMLRKVDVEQRLGEIPAITCSPSQVNQVLLSIVSNAAQAIEKPRGRIMIETRRVPGPAVAIEITDDGKGIPPEVLPKIFDPFFTTKEGSNGAGLGLSIAHKIVTEHGGRIEVQSRRGKGTTFIVVLPVKPPGTA